MASSGPSKMEDDQTPSQAGSNISHHHSHDPNLHPHFLVDSPEDDLEAHDSKINMVPEADDAINVKLGFLQVKHIYEVKLFVENDLGKDVQFDPLQNLNAKLESAIPSENGKGHDLTIIFNASKEKIMKEKITLSSKETNPRHLYLVLHARVLGKGKGTPSLKKGIHCIRIECDEESENSDWQGH